MVLAFRTPIPASMSDTARRRRDPLAWSIGALALVAFVTIAYVLLAAASVDESVIDPWVTIDVADYGPGEWRTVVIDQEPYIVKRLSDAELRQASALSADRVAVKQSVEDRIAMVPVDKGTTFAPFAIYRRIDDRGFCMAIPLGDSEDAAVWTDACYDSKFDAAGRALSGPASELPQPHTRLRRGQLQITTDAAIRRAAR